MSDSRWFSEKKHGFKRDPQTLAIITNIMIAIVAALIYFMLVDRTGYVENKESFIGIYSALIAIQATMIVSCTFGTNKAQPMTKLALGTITMISLAEMLGFSILILDPVIPIERVTEWVLSALIAAGIVFGISLATLILARRRVHFIPDKREGARSRILKLALANLVGAIIAIFIFAWNEIGPPNSIVYPVVAVVLIAVALMISLLMPMADLLGERLLFTRFYRWFSEKILGFKNNPQTLAIITNIVIVIVAALTYFMLVDRMGYVENKESFIGTYSALIAIQATIIVLLHMWNNKTQSMTRLALGTITTISLAEMLGFSILILDPVIPFEIASQWALSALIAAGIVFAISLATVVFMRMRAHTRITNVFALYMVIFVLIATVIMLLVFAVQSSSEEHIRALAGIYVMLELALIPLVYMAYVSPKRPQRGISAAALLAIFAGIFAVANFDNIDTATTGEDFIALGALLAPFISLSAIVIALSIIWLTIIPDKREGARSRILKLALVNLVGAIIAIFIFAWNEIGPPDSIVSPVVVGIVIAVALMISLLMPMTDLLGYARAEKVRFTWFRLWKILSQYRQNRFGMFGLIVLLIVIGISIAGPFIAPENPRDLKVPESDLPQPPSWEHIMGTDFEDKDVYSQFLWGARISLIVGILAGMLSAIIGTAVGITAGYFGRVSDEVLMRLTDFFLVIPWLPFMIVLIAILGRSFLVVILVIGIVSWAPTARVVRAAVLSIKEKMYIERSIALGAGRKHIITRHIFPNVFPLIVATSILLVAEAIYSEAFLDFFGLGDPDIVSWGWMLERAHAKSAMLNWWWWWILPPAVGIILLIMSFYLVGDTLDEILNPRLKRR